ncbi:ubiquitin-binding protein cue5 [Sporothrix epigloea]|uniref:Ubiquitin-binding protein cue5 n=1 Tax=Sporothrix epigloea TaxID=1892477 RepID=A0ABP0E5V1_9PEZI
MDDDDIQEASTAHEDGVNSKITSSAAASPAALETLATTVTDAADEASEAAAAEIGPPKPPRPMNEQQKNEQTLREAFPDVDSAVVRAVLTASRGNIEAAFHALLEMTDPSAVQHELAPPPPPPRPAMSPAGRLSPNSQLLADEEYARQLAHRYETEDGDYEARTSRGRGYYTDDGGRMRHHKQPPRGESSLKPNEMWGEKEHSFLDDDLPVITENLRKGFAETQTKFNTWFTGIKKKIDEEWIGNDEDVGRRTHGSGQGQGQGQGRQAYGQNLFGGRHPPRRSGDYDADPTLLSDDLAGIQLHGDGTPVRQNPHVLRPQPSSTSPRSGSERKVGFRDQNEIVDSHHGSTKITIKDGTASPATSAAKASKWQPMSSVEPAPITDNDPFSLGDSEDEKDNAVSTTIKHALPSNEDSVDIAAKKSPSLKSPEADRLRKAAAEAMSESLVDGKK